MLEITNKQLVTTRKPHECFACTTTIDKGIQAIHATAKQDEQHMRFHLHTECNIKLTKNKHALPDGIYYGCLNDIEPTPQWLLEG
ncbi:hypothetical protein [Metasolibacillus sp.]|uniref:hypothetical protein n=1 Tax=Metasolibacillus sp. TaxID=2703680 RepID=UPI0025F6CAAD|nr:hypothetical protein [Metasolibacillus sp.]MCT6925294.1 hypothetical protein [Metasolibacillus sp.]MCT6941476.1 hypothetical protein [Metasolibacillus sp.]